MAASLKLRTHASLSPFDDLKERRLPNWGRSGRRAARLPSAGIASIYDAGKKDNRPGVDSNKEYSETHDDGPPRIDERDADNLDGFIMQIGANHRKVLCDQFYRQKSRASRYDLDAAVRCLLDAVEANRATTDKVRVLAFNWHQFLTGR